MAPRRPTTAHVTELLHAGQRRQFIAASTADLVRQVRQAAPDLPPVLVDQLARLVIAHQARLELPGLVTLRHLRTLTATPGPAATERAAVPAAALNDTNSTGDADDAPAALQQSEPRTAPLRALRAPPRLVASEHTMTVPTYYDAGPERDEDE